MSFDKLLPAITGLLGVLIGGLTLVFAGWIESEKQSVITRTNALVEFATMTSRREPGDQLQYSQKVAGLMVFANEPILKAYERYNSSCSETADEAYQCRLLWAVMLNEMRKSADHAPVDPDVLIRMNWGDLGTK